MWDSVTSLFDTTGFPPRWRCGTGWTDAEGWLHVLSDLGVWSAYLAIPLVLYFLIRRRRDLPFRGVFVLFGAFILACGTTHLMEAIIFWWPAYRLAGAIKLFTAIVSWSTVVALVRIVPDALTLRSPHELQHEIDERKKVEAELRDMQGELERRVAVRTAELAQINTTLQAEVNDHKRTEQALRESEQRERERAAELETVLRATPAPIWIAQDPECRVITGNPAANRLLRLQEGENATSTPASDQPNRRSWREFRGGKPVPGDELPVQMAAAKGVEVHGAELTMVFDDGTARHIYGNAVPLRNGDGQVRGSIAAFMDVTELKQATEEIKKADRQKDEFLAMLSHELRNPLAPLRNAILLIKQDKHDAATLNWAIDMMERQVEMLVRLVDDLLDVSRITRGKIELKRSPVELTTIVKRAVETAHPLIDGQRHKLSVALPQEPVWLEADAVRMAQAVANLLNNAAKYTEPEGEIQLAAELEGNGVTLRVKDNGVGIDPHLLPQIFDLFTQADRSIERSQGGLGIGLTLVRSLVEMHGGSVTASSAGIGRGSEFAIHLPARSELSEPDHPASATGPVVPRRVLLVEDNVGAALVLSKLLTKFWGHEVETAHDGPAALEAARKFQPEVVLLDLGLPGLSGFEVARRLRAESNGRAMLIVALTGYGQGEDRRQTAEAGFDEHLVKPPGVDMLERVFQHPKLAAVKT